MTSVGITPELMKLIDVIAEAGTNLRIAACAKPENRPEWLRRLERDTVEARRLADEYTAKGNVLHDRIKIELRTCELGLAKLKEANSGGG